MRWLELMKAVWHVAIMINASGSHSLEILFKAMPDKNEKYQIGSDKYHFDRVKIIQHYRNPALANMAVAGLQVTAI
ncbi:hypothetical protein MPE84_07150 [Aeromonas veronii]|uniref:hypothetical protein n=1 Tax=Aeromonas veronii TaxID=654 RepID=UPI001FD711CE|nr:hypothetical protein [Aeromonas veronii]MCJ8234049.1 hypothetical protein [Aeromonas veronii]